MFGESNSQKLSLYTYTHIYMSGGRNDLPIFIPILFSGVHLVVEVFQDTWCSNKENSSAHWGENLSCPLMASNYGKSYLVLISFWMLTMPWFFWSYLVLQTCISFCSVSDKSGACIKMPLLVCMYVCLVCLYVCLSVCMYVTFSGWSVKRLKRTQKPNKTTN